MTNEELDVRKKFLIEKLGVNLEKIYQMPPVAARIFSTLILTGKQGITFDALVKELGASKSTVSTNLENLKKTDKITYFTKPGDRKRYFVINPHLTLNVIDEMVNKWKMEKSIHEDIIEYKQMRNQFLPNDGQQFDLEFNRNFLVFLEEATAAIEKLRANIVLGKDQLSNL